MATLSKRSTVALIRSPKLLYRRRITPSPSPLSIRTFSSPPPSPESPGTADIQTLHKEIKKLQQLIRDQQSQSERAESLTRTISQQSAQLKQRLEGIEEHVNRISAVEKVVTGLQDFLHNNPAMRFLLGNIETIVSASRPIVKQYKYVLLGLAASLVVIWQNRSHLFYQKTSEEVADLARLTLEQESLKQSIQDTLHTVANSPSTLTTLNDLLQELITHERTQKQLVDLLVYAVNTPEVQNALLNLLQTVFENPHLQKLTGEFLLKGLDEPGVKAMLDAQTAQLVRDTVADDSVQQATAVGLQNAFRYSMTPSFLWRFMGSNNSKQESNVETEEVETYEASTAQESATTSQPSQ